MIKSPLSFPRRTSSKGAQNKSSPKEIYPLDGRTFSSPSAINKNTIQTEFKKKSSGHNNKKKHYFNIRVGQEWLTCSGAMYEGVPLPSVLSSEAPAVTRPKSPIFTSVFWLNMMFSGCGGEKQANTRVRTAATSHRVRWRAPHL